ncbi:hypothetical protein JEZ13_04240 [bacterium]|nr:hypothetical protein [bacterium]MBI9072931.1 hypothetical protein [Melioribacteraceae bacterium]
MGGNALKKYGIETKRLNKEEYFIVAEEIKARLLKHFKKAEPVIAYANKEDFGDLDILVCDSRIENLDMLKLINDEFNPNAIHRNGEVTSFDYDDFQIDVIKVKPEELEMAMHYFSFNDLGNFMGRIARKLGFKYGHKGLFYVPSIDNKYVMKDILVSRTPSKIFRFLGFDYYAYVDGFKELEDVFSYVVNSKYFSSDIFSYENLNHINRIRNRKRRSYQLFIQYLEEHFPDKTYDYDTPEAYMQRASVYFGKEFMVEIDIANAKAAEIKAYREKFNGNRVMKLIPPLQGKELGDFMRYINTDDVFVKLIKDTDTDNMDEAIKKMYLYYSIRKR